MDWNVFYLERAREFVTGRSHVRTAKTCEPDTQAGCPKEKPTRMGA